MTLGDLFKALDEVLSGHKYTSTFDFKLEKEYQKESNYPYDDQEPYDVTEDIIEIRVDKKNRTITFK